jgi:hypothetical protein
VLFQNGLVSEEEPDLGHELVLEISSLKDEFHEPILRQFGREVPGAMDFIEHVVESGLAGRPDRLALLKRGRERLLAALLLWVVKPR